MTDELKRAVIWKNLSLNGIDYCALWQTAEGWLVKGTVAGVLQDQQPMLATYEVHCNGDWRTQRVEVVRTIGAESKSLSLTVSTRGVWRSSGQELPAVQGCEDVDLALTPATNTLPIRRLALDVGESASVIAAWVQFPELTIQPLSQRYTRISSDKYHYESNTGFAADIGVDDLGLITNYPGGWERLTGS